ncbi:MAG TPA: endopeptidase La [Armatimonadetes bacterium]|nr:endopeptidase La [Armatimonadota bacterium]
MRRRRRQKEWDSTHILPVLPVHDLVIFPHEARPLYAGREGSVRALEQAMREERQILIVAQRDPSIQEEDPAPEDLYRVGTISRILQMLTNPDNTLRVVVEGVVRAQVREYAPFNGYLAAVVEPLVVEAEESLEIEALTRGIKECFDQAVNLGKNLPPEVISHILSIEDPEHLLDAIAPHLTVRTEEKQELLEMTSLQEALLRLRVLLERELEILEIERRIDSQVRKEVGDSQKEFILRERLKAIQQELEELNGEGDEISQLRQAIKEAQMTKEAQEKALKELHRLERMPPVSPESVVIRTYLDTLIELPWNKRTKDKLDLDRAARILEEDHYGLTQVKERVLEFLAVRKLTRRTKGPILCFVGPPGVGKTSIGKSIARAMGRKFVRISLGGVRDEAEIRGHRRTYIGSMPGRIMQTIKQIGVKNPVFMLDEVDKLGVDFRGDPSAALLEALDPEQNSEFSDHYLEVRFDLSEVMFLMTANVLDTIPPALRDRMEVIEFRGYIEDEKVQIAKQFLIPKQLKANGLKVEHLHITDDALRKIIREYTREAGVRNLERTIASLCRKVARKIAAGEKTRMTVRARHLSKLLGPPPFAFGPEKEEEDQIGVATGLAYTPQGGTLLAVEVALVEGQGELTLTGLLGDVMKESAQAAWTYARSRAKQLNASSDLHDKVDVHIHVPEGATPKDGPSAGVTMAVALASALSQRPVRKEVGMTGEITLRGRILPVGGVKEKVLAAYRAGLSEVILPQENKRDWEEIPRNVRRHMTFHFVKHMDEVLNLALLNP